MGIGRWHRTCRCGCRAVLPSANERSCDLALVLRDVKVPLCSVAPLKRSQMAAPSVASFLVAVSSSRAQHVTAGSRFSPYSGAAWRLQSQLKIDPSASITQFGRRLTSKSGVWKPYCSLQSVCFVDKPKDKCFIRCCVIIFVCVCSCCVWFRDDGDIRQDVLRGR
ncbi:hypothetical protein LSTR_LSTR012821 [Laodelphax striatellus]|uniref:Uncharacterized protein n=1 Tax=Laodelphax striatellus TaxID=195883 RepID=A0A482XDZ4_LAOST|nr:hypothetical protein LSTR_LSTR012821 [Laodelphax striatellus]